MDINQNRQSIISIFIVLIVLVGGAFLFIRGTKPSAGAPGSASTTSSASTTDMNIAGGTLGITGTGGYTVREISAGASAPQAPDYRAPLVFSSSLNLTAEQKSAIEAQATASRATLAKDPSNYTAWLSLGRSFKAAGDYAQAAKIWNYLSLNWPTDAISLENLGDLYMNFIRDYPKADASYLGAIQRDVHQINAYRNLFSLYTNLYTTRASSGEDILKKGIQNNPDALDLYVLLARYYRDSGRTAEARAEYEIVIALARKQPNSDALVADLVSEQAALQ